MMDGEVGAAQGADMMANMSPDMMKAGMDMMKNMDPKVMAQMSKSMGREIDPAQMEQMQSMMSNMDEKDMEKWAKRAQAVARVASGPVAAFKKCQGWAAALGAAGGMAIIAGALAVMAVGHVTELF